MLVVTYIANSTIPSRSANSIHVMKMCEALAEVGAAVELIFPIKGDEAIANKDSPFNYYGVRPIFSLRLLARPFLRGSRYYFAVMSALRAWFRGTSLAYCRNHWAAYFCAKFGMDTVFEAHAPIPVDDQRGLFLFKSLIRCGNFRRLIVITHTLKDHYESLYSELAGKISVLPDAASPLKENTIPAVIRGISTFCVGYVGQLYRGKGMELILRLAPLCPEVNFHIIGGLDEDISYWKSQSEGLSNVIFHGFVPHALVPGYILAMDAVLLPNQVFVSASGSGKRNISEWTSPLKVFEYMAAGKAVLASDLPVLREILRDGDNALLCDPESPEQWHAAIKRLRSEPSLKKKLERSSFEDFERHYSWRARARCVLDLVT